MKFMTFGEIMLRLKSPGLERFFQSQMLEATFGGGEANVAVSLANYGQDVAYLTVLPKNVIADECIRDLRKFGVDVSRIVQLRRGCKPYRPQRQGPPRHLFPGDRRQPAPQQGRL